MSEQNEAEIKLNFVTNRDEVLQDLARIGKAREDLAKKSAAAAKMEADAEKAILDAYRQRMNMSGRPSFGSAPTPSGGPGTGGGGGGGRHDDADEYNAQRFGQIARRWHRRMTAIESISGMGEMLGALAGGKAGAAIGAGAGTIFQSGINIASSHASHAARRLNVSNNASLADFQKTQMLSEDLPVIGGLLRSLRELNQAVDGTTEALRQNAITYADRRADIGSHIGLEMQSIRNRGQLQEAQNRAGVLGQSSIVPQGQFDRSTSQGEAAYRQAQRLQPYLDRAAEAQREVEIARRNEAAARGRMGGLDGRIDQLIQNRADTHRNLTAAEAAQRRFAGSTVFETNPIQRGLFGGSSWSRMHDRTADIDALRREQAAISDDLAQTRQARGGLVNEAQGATLARINAERRQRDAMTDVNRGRLANLQESESNMSNRATTFGRMTWIERQQGLNALRMIRQHGIQNVPQDIVASAERIDPAFVQRAAQNFGENTQEYRAHQREFAPETERGSLRDIRTEMATVQDQIRQAAIDSANLAAEAQMAAFREFGRILTDNLQRAMNEIVNRRNEDRAVGNLHQGQGN